MILAQATQPDTWVWTNITPEKLALWVAVWSAAATAAILALFKIINLLIEQFAGSKKLWREKVDGQIGALARDSSSTPTPPTPNDKAILEAAAATPPKAQ